MRGSKLTPSPLNAWTFEYWSGELSSPAPPSSNFSITHKLQLNVGYYANTSNTKACNPDEERQELKQVVGKGSISHSKSCLTLCNLMVCSLARLLCPWNSPSKDTGVGCHFLLQVIFLTQGSNSGLLHCRHSLLFEPPGKAGGEIN